jgi:hypothetical protein
MWERSVVVWLMGMGMGMNVGRQQWVVLVDSIRDAI